MHASKLVLSEKKTFCSKQAHGESVCGPGSSELYLRLQIPSPLLALASHLLYIARLGPR